MRRAASPLPFPARVPFVDALGIALHRYGDGVAEHRLRALGQVLHRSAALAFCEARLFDDRDQLCAAASGTFKYLRALPTRPSAAAGDPNRTEDKP